MEKKYRLLDVGECIERWNEWLDPTSGWVSVPESLWGSECSVRPMRRPDDGMGRYLLTDILEGTDFWKWGVGWVSMPNHVPTSDGAIWRRAREMEKPTHGLWVVIHTAGPCEDYTKLDNDVIFTSWQEACDAAKQQARINGDGAEFSVAHIDRTFRCEVSVVEKEVGK